MKCFRKRYLTLRYTGSSKLCVAVRLNRAVISLRGHEFIKSREAANKPSLHNERLDELTGLIKKELRLLGEGRVRVGMRPWMTVQYGTIERGNFIMSVTAYYTRFIWKWPYFSN